MKKIILFVFILASFNPLLAQDSLKVKTKKFFIGANFSPDLCSGFLTKPVFDNMGLKVLPGFGFTSGIKLCYVFSKHFSVNMGIQYSQKNYDIKTNLTFGDTIDRRRGFVYNTNGLDNNNRYQYIDIPIIVNYITGKHKAQFIIGAGLTTNILLKETSSSFVVGGNISRLNLSPTISAGISYKTSPRTFIRIEPTFRCGILKVSSDLATQYIWNTGINCSFYF